MDYSPQVSLSMEFSRQAYGSGLPFLPLGDLHDPGTEPISLALAGRFLTIAPLLGKPMSSLEKSLFRSSTLVLIRLFYTELHELFVYFGDESLAVPSFANIFSHSEGYLFLFIISIKFNLVTLVFCLYFHFSRRLVKKYLDVVYVRNCSTYIFLYQFYNS